MPPAKQVPDPRSGGFFVVAVALLYALGGAPLRSTFGEAGVLFAELLLLALPAVAWVHVADFDPGRSLSLARPSRRGLGGGVLLVLGALPVVALLGWLQSFVLPVPRGVLEELQRQVTADSPRRLAWLVLLLALTPAVCEEIVFRGVLLSATRPWGASRAIIFNGLVFGLFHLSGGTLVRFLPTATLGILIAWSVWRTGSIWVGMTMHAANNATIVVSSSLPAVRSAIGDPSAPPPTWLLVVGVVVSVIAARILLLSTPHAGAGHTVHEGI